MFTSVKGTLVRIAPNNFWPEILVTIKQQNETLRSEFLQTADAQSTMTFYIEYALRDFENPVVVLISCVESSQVEIDLTDLWFDDIFQMDDISTKTQVIKDQVVVGTGSALINQHTLRYERSLPVIKSVLSNRSFFKSLE